MKFNETQAEMHPILAAPKPVRRREIALATVVAMLVLIIITLITVALLVDSFGGRLLFGP